ncbi:Nn.00g070910.m01.CDS01 [Neocucurbitaria sp. VM-36]
MVKNVSLVTPVEITECTAATADYRVNFTVSNGVRRTDYSTNNKQSILLPVPVLSSKSQDYGPLRTWEEYNNHLALLDSLRAELFLTDYELVDIWYDESDLEESELYQLPDGTNIEVCPTQILAQWSGSGIPDFRHSSILALSAFNTQRDSYPDSMSINELKFSETLLNEVLANITISALSLNLWYGLVNGTTSRTLNTYKFEHRLSFYLPYGLCLGFTLPIVLIGLLALHHNGVSAIDGGFLQVLMTTTGNTELRKLATKACIGGEENIPKELKKLKVQFGELLVRDTMQNDSASVFGGDDDRSTEGVTTGRDCNPSKANTVIDRNSIALDDLQSDRGQERIRDGHASTYTKLASGSSTHKLRTNSLQRTGFGTLYETKELRKGYYFE